MSDPTRAAELLRGLRRADGGYAPGPQGESEPEPTALAALALSDTDALRWLEAHQTADGALLIGPVELRNDAASPLAALALAGEPRERALDYLERHQAQPLGFDPRFPHDPETRGWGWTSATAAWVEPTARAVLALKAARPSSAAIADGIAVLADRECTAGGWNYGNREVLGRDLEPFLQTSAIGLMAVQDGPAALRDRARGLVETLWREEAGGLGWAMSLVALRLTGGDATPLADALDRMVDETHLLEDGVALAWASLGLGDGWQNLQVPN